MTKLYLLNLLLLPHGATPPWETVRESSQLVGRDYHLMVTKDSPYWPYRGYLALYTVSKYPYQHIKFQRTEPADTYSDSPRQWRHGTHYFVWFTVPTEYNSEHYGVRLVPAESPIQRNNEARPWIPLELKSRVFTVEKYFGF